MSSRRTTVTRRAAAAALAGVALPGAGRARTDAQDPAGTPDVALLHLDGRSVRWRGDVLRDRIAVVNFVFTTCTSLCPPSSAVMAALQREPGISAAGGTTFVSLSIDPLSDSPQRLRAFARPFDPGPDWWWLTGAPGDVFKLLDALQAGVGSDPQSHAPLWLVGRAGRGAWRRLLGTPSAEQFRSVIASLRS